jgi:hypothetical protein
VCLQCAGYLFTEVTREYRVDLACRTLFLLQSPAGTASISRAGMAYPHSADTSQNTQDVVCHGAVPYRASAICVISRGCMTGRQSKAEKKARDKQLMVHTPHWAEYCSTSCALPFSSCAVLQGVCVSHETHAIASPPRVRRTNLQQPDKRHGAVRQSLQQRTVWPGRSCFACSCRAIVLHAYSRRPTSEV